MFCEHQAKKPATVSFQIYDLPQWDRPPVCSATVLPNTTPPSTPSTAPRTVRQETPPRYMSTPSAGAIQKTMYIQYGQTLTWKQTAVPAVPDVPAPLSPEFAPKPPVVGKETVADGMTPDLHQSTQEIELPLSETSSQSDLDEVLDERQSPQQ